MPTKQKKGFVSKFTGKFVPYYAPTGAMAGKGAYRPKYKSTVRRPGYKGHGFYKGFGKDVGSWLGNKLGGLVGLGDLGSQLGGMAGQLGSNVTGFGAYTVKHNVLAAGVPTISNPTKEGTTVIRHREFIGNVLSSVDFQVQYNLPLNPAQSSTFPWASQVASAYQQYRMDGAIYEYIATSGDATGTNTALGVVAFMTDYNSLDSAPTTMQQVLNQEFSTSGKPSNTFMHPIECAREQTTVPILYTRPGDVPPGADVRLYDLARTYVVTEGNQSNGGSPIVQGQLWLTYQFTVLKPQLDVAENDGPTVYSAHYQLSAGAVTLPYPLYSAVSVMDDIGLTIANPASTVSTLQWPAESQGLWLVNILWNQDGAITGGIAISPSYSSGMSTLTPFIGDGAQFLQTNPVTAAPYAYAYTQVIQITSDEPQTLTLTDGGGETGPVGTWGGDLIVTQLNNAWV